MTRPLAAAAAVAAAVALTFADGNMRPALAVPIAAEPVAGSELPELRTRTSRTYLQSDGSRLAQVFPGPVHFKNAAGAWQTIEPELIAAAAGYRNLANSFTVHLPRRLDQGDVRFAADGAWLAFGLRGASGTAEVSGHRASYRGALPGVDAVYTSETSALKEELILTSATAARSFTFDLTLSSGLHPRPEAAGAVSFVDDQDNVQMRMARPVMTDASGVQSNRISVRLTENTDGWVITIAPDQRWLDDPARRWPIVIDPVVTRSPELDCTVDDGVSGECTAATLAAGLRFIPPLGYDIEYRSLLRFDVAGVVPGSADVIDANMALYRQSGTEQFSAHPILTPWTSTSLAWNDIGPPADTISVGGAGSGFYRWKLTQLTRDWLSGSAANHGVLVRQTPTRTGCCKVTFASSEADDPSQRPYLEVNYDLAESPELQARAAASYAQRYGVSLAEATARLEFQDEVSVVADNVTSALGADHAGMWFDGVDAGRLKIGVATTASEPSGPGVEEAKAILSQRGLLGRSDFLSKQETLDNLMAQQPGLDERLMNLMAAGKVSTGVRPPLNALVINTATDLSAADTAQVNDAAAQTPVPVRILSTGAPSGGSVQEACARGSAVAEMLYCDRPLRGGVRITSGGLGCTAGFMARGITDSAPGDAGDLYVLTAGHCVAVAEDWSSRTTLATQHLIGAREPGWQWGPSADAGLINIATTSHWRQDGSGPEPWVVVDSSDNTEYNAAYRIRRTSRSEVGQEICRTSGQQFPSGNWTECGEVVELGHTEYFEDTGVLIRNLGVANICGSVPAPGSSGGPYYKRHRAYGIHVGAEQSTACRVYYQGVRGAQDAMGVDILTAK